MPSAPGPLEARSTACSRATAERWRCSAGVRRSRSRTGSPGRSTGLPTMSNVIDPASTRCDADARVPDIPLCIPHLGGNEWRYVKECLDSNFVSSAGPFVDRFERELAARVGARFGVATSTGTAALHVALLVAGVEPDDEVIVPTLTFIATVNAVRYAGAWPVL